MRVDRRRLGYRQTTQDDVIPSSLPLLDFVSNKYSIRDQRPFEGYKILAVQHLLGSTLPLFSALETGGANPKDIYLVGKAYSSHPLVIDRLRQRGYSIALDEVFDFEEDQPYDSILEKHILRSCSALLESMGDDQRGLIIDDGGHAIELLHQSSNDRIGKFSCVEQTSRGARVIANLSLACPIVNVAQSITKTQIESPMIARAMVNGFTDLLRTWKEANIYHPKNATALLLGFGNIGSQVAVLLRNSGFAVIIYECDESRRLEAVRSGFTIATSIPRVCSSASIVIGCTGAPVISHEELCLLESGTLLVNMASTDTEFRAWELRRSGVIIHERVLPSDILFLHDRMPLSWRSLYEVQMPSGRIYLANGGFPCDFSGKINPVPAGEIQLTSALLLGGAIQSVHEERSGFLELDIEFQKALIAEYQEY